MGFMEKVKDALTGDKATREAPPKREKPKRSKPTKPPQREESKKKPKAAPEAKAEPRREPPKKKPKAPVAVPQEASSFAPDEEVSTFFERQQRLYDEDLRELDDLPEVSVRAQRIQDILEVLDIPATFELETDVYLPEELHEPTFDLQTPYGYDQGQVASYRHKVDKSIQRYYSLLRRRNEDVARLASMVDKLQVHANNARYDSEINQGISIISTEDDEDVKSLYLEEKLKTKRLEDALKRYEAQEGGEEGETSAGELQAKLEALQDALSVAQRKAQDLARENSDLRHRVTVYEEEAEASDVTPSVGDHEILLFPQGSSAAPPPAASSAASLAEALPDEEDALPDEEEDDLGGPSADALPLEEEERLPGRAAVAPAPEASAFAPLDDAFSTIGADDDLFEGLEDEESSLLAAPSAPGADAPGRRA